MSTDFEKTLKLFNDSKNSIRANLEKWTQCLNEFKVDLEKWTAIKKESESSVKLLSRKFEPFKQAVLMEQFDVKKLAVDFFRNIDIEPLFRRG